MATETDNQAPDSSTEEPNSVRSKTSAAFQQLAAKFLKPLTQEQEQAAAERDAQIRADEIRAEQAERSRRFADFIRGRDEYGACKFSAWKYPGNQHDARQKVVVDAAVEFARDVATHRASGIGCLFYGPPGTGKDHLATCIIRAACLQHGHSAKFINGVEWFVALRDSMDSDRQSEGDLIREVAQPDWVVLSDPLPPGNEPLSQYQASMMYRLVDVRSSMRKPTIITINVKDGDEATRRIGGATWDRIRHRAWVFGCNWPSHRQPERVV